jgi:type IVB pilus formation R64 PilN family outer membrane protein
MLSKPGASHALLLTLAIGISGCAGGSDLEGLVQERSDSIQSRTEMARQPAPMKRSADPLTVTDSVWVGDAAFKMPSGEPLPAEWQRPDAFAMRSDTPVLLQQLTAVISSQTKIPIRLTGGAERIGSDAVAAAPAGGAGGGAGAPASPAGATTSASDPGMILAYEGPLSGLLDLISGFYNLSWQYSQGTIVINRYVTRTFVLDALPGSISVSAPAGTGASGTAAGSASATPLATANIDIWNDITQTVEGIVDGNGAVTVSQSSGTMVVSTTTDRMEQVARYISDENARLSRQVAVTIELFTVNVDDDAVYGLNLNAAISNITNLPTFDLTGPTTGLTDPAQLTITLVEPSELAGTVGIVEALSTLGKTTRIAQIPVTTLNNRPANQRIAVDTAYVSSVTSSAAAGSGGSGSSVVSTSASTSTVTTGISVSILPRIMSDGRILLQYALAQGELLRLRNFEVGDNTLQLPETQGLSFSQQVMMKNGSTLVLSGFDQSDADTSARGMGRPLTWLLGGSTQSRQGRQLVVIAITPREIRIARREAS